MTARLLPFPNFFRPATPRDEPCEVVKFPHLGRDYECPKITELRRQSKMLREHFKRRRCECLMCLAEGGNSPHRIRETQFSGGTCSGGE